MTDQTRRQASPDNPLIKDRTAYLRSLLDSPSGMTSDFEIVRALARLVIEQDKELARLPFISQLLGSLSSQIYEFMQEQLAARQRREHEEAERARLQYEKSKQAEQYTSQKLQAIKMGPPQVTPATPGNTEFSTWVWFRDGVLKDIVKLVVLG